MFQVGDLVVLTWRTPKTLNHIYRIVSTTPTANGEIQVESAYTLPNGRGDAIDYASPTELELLTPDYFCDIIANIRQRRNR